MRTRQDLLSIFGTIALFVILETGSILMITHNGVIQKIGMMEVIRSAQSLAWETTAKIRHYFSYRELNEELFAENIRLKEELAAYKSSDFSRDTSFSSIDSKYRYIGARVVKNTVNTQHNYIILNKGSLDGITEGMGVVTENGVVGIINGVSDHYSYVISFLNETQNISVKIPGSEVFGIMSWGGKSTRTAYVREIPTHVDIAMGDYVMTSGYSSVFPPDIPIGRVEDVTSRDGNLQLVEVSLFENYHSLNHVYAVQNIGAEEIKKLESDVN